MCNRAVKAVYMQMYAIPARHEVVPAHDKLQTKCQTSRDDYCTQQAKHIRSKLHACAVNIDMHVNLDTYCTMNVPSLRIETMQVCTHVSMP